MRKEHQTKGLAPEAEHPTNGDSRKRKLEKCRREHYQRTRYRNTSRDMSFPVQRACCVTGPGTEHEGDPKQGRPMSVGTTVRIPGENRAPPQEYSVRNRMLLDFSDKS